MVLSLGGSTVGVRSLNGSPPSSLPRSEMLGSVQQHRQSSKLLQAAVGSKALELGGEPVSKRGCLPTKLTDTHAD